MRLPFDRDVLVTLLIALAVAALAAFDQILIVLSHGRADIRIGIVAVVTLLGGAAARKLGLKLAGHGSSSPVLTGLSVAAAVAAWVLLVDVYLFRHLLDPEYVAFLQRPVTGKLIYFMPRAFLENVLYRLFAFSALAMLILRIPGMRVRRGLAFALAMTLAQMINIWANVVAITPHPVTFEALSYDFLRYVTPGIVWAILFIRNGFFTAEVASVGCHLFLQPAFTLMLAPR